MIDSCDFLAAKRRSETEPLLPTGTRIAFTSGPAYQDHNRIWAVLEKVLAKYPAVKSTYDKIKAIADATK